MMKQEYKILLVGLLGVTLIAILGSIASKQLNFNYSFLSFITFIIYGTIGFLGTRKKNLKTGVLYAAILGLFDSTVGWKLSMLLGANLGDIDIETTIELWIMTVVLMTGVSALIGLMGGGLSRIMKNRSTTAQQRR